jgi:hypothetical protein
VFSNSQDIYHIDKRTGHHKVLQVFDLVCSWQQASLFRFRRRLDQSGIFQIRKEQGFYRQDSDMNDRNVSENRLRSVRQQLRQHSSLNFFN